ncbi:MAG: peptidoglycan-associated lipoprotein Pal [Acidobacteriota bacterium]
MALLFATAVLVAGCHKKPPVAAAPPRSPAVFPGAVAPTVTPANRPPDPPVIPADTPVTSTAILPWSDKSLDAINGPDSPLKPIYFNYDSDELDDLAKQIVTANAAVLKTYSSWIITVEGHCDERGTAEYNLALGDRRALAAKNFLVSLGIPADRIRTVSYGKEFPFDAGHVEGSWAKNRRAHFMLTSK